MLFSSLFGGFQSSNARISLISPVSSLSATVSENGGRASEGGQIFKKSPIFYVNFMLVFIWPFQIFIFIFSILRLSKSYFLALSLIIFHMLIISPIHHEILFTCMINHVIS